MRTLCAPKRNSATRHGTKVAAVTVLVMFLTFGCDEKIIEPDCEGCFRYHVDYPASGTSEVLRDVYFIDSVNGWAVGNDGIILHSEDGGATWTKQHEKMGQRLWSVHFLTPDLGWVINELDSLLRTGDGGDTCSERRIGAGHGLTAVFFYDQLRGWAVGDDIILRTNNGGTSWQVYGDIDDVVSTMYGVSFPHPNRGWAVGSGVHKILYTDNSGDHWTPQSNPSTQPLLDVTFADETHGWAVGVGGMVLHTSDGINWTKQAIGTDRVLHGVDFWDVGTGVVVGDSGVVYTTSDGGTTWEERVSGTTNDLLKVSYIDSESFCACGYHGALLVVTREWDDCCE